MTPKCFWIPPGAPYLPPGPDPRPKEQKFWMKEMSSVLAKNRWLTKSRRSPSWSSNLIKVRQFIFIRFSQSLCPSRRGRPYLP